MFGNFFRINLPYGIARNDQGEWMAFNREYMPLGYNDTSLKGDPGNSFQDLPIYTSYKGLTEKVLTELAHSSDAIRRNENNEITTIFLYNDRSNPTNQYEEKPHYWKLYFEKLKKLSELQTKH
uniref:hypothetical protein n=1 Tax=Microscilla sp. PRE1 TaxID=155537 RepID=UPI00146E9C3D|nr:hypothetical protein [Microscilla sp. PRE1]